MIKIVAMSDTHVSSLDEFPEKLINLIEDADMLVHAGDFDKYRVYKELSRYNLIAVRGDSDEESIRLSLPDVRTFKVENVSFGVVHKGNYLNEFHDLGYKAMELGVNVLIFGHIHRFVLEKFKDVLILCPGSPTFPRLSIASCAEIIVDGSKVDIKCKVTQDVVCGYNWRNRS